MTKASNDHGRSSRRTVFWWIASKTAWVWEERLHGVGIRALLSLFLLQAWAEREYYGSYQQWICLCRTNEASAGVLWVFRFAILVWLDRSRKAKNYVSSGTSKVASWREVLGRDMKKEHPNGLIPCKLSTFAPELRGILSDLWILFQGLGAKLRQRASSFGGSPWGSPRSFAGKT